jgi:hypothetical protein
MYKAKTNICLDKRKRLWPQSLIGNDFQINLYQYQYLPVYWELKFNSFNQDNIEIYRIITKNIF